MAWSQWREDVIADVVSEDTYVLAVEGLGAVLGGVDVEFSSRPRGECECAGLEHGLYGCYITWE